MANVKISELPVATLPILGTSEVPMVQNGVTVKTSVNDLRDFISVTAFGAVGNGVTDDTTAIQNAELNVPVYAPPGTYLANGVANPTVLVGRQYGSGQIKTADGNKSAPNFSIATQAPSALGNYTNLKTAFNGDLSRCVNAVGMHVSGAASLGQPTNSYQYTPELSAYYTVFENTSGFCQVTPTTAGRTGATAFRTLVKQNGQGDAVAYNGSVSVTQSLPGATSFLENPAGVLFNGEVGVFTNGGYCNPIEINCSDSGFDAAAIGFVNNLIRDNDTGALNTVWISFRAQSIGTKFCDAFLSANGKFKNGLDLVTANLGTNQSAVSLSAGQRIYFNNTATPTGGTGIAWVTNNYGGEYVAYTPSGITTFFGQNAPQFGIGRTLNAVNFATVEGAPTNQSPLFRAIGADTNVSLGFTTKGNGSFFFYGNNGSAVNFVVSGAVTNAANYLQVNSAATGSSPSLTPQGTDANIDLKLYAKGSGGYVDLGTQTDGSAGALIGYMVIKIFGTSYKVPYYAMA
jgi:hypothetical protein